MLALTHPVVRRLFGAQALFMSCSLIAITLTSLVGARLAPDPGLATLPLALQVVGVLAATQPLSLLMQRRGRAVGLSLGALAGGLGGVISAGGVWSADFVAFCAGALVLGVYQASAMFYRFAAFDAVESARRGQATAVVLGGGIVAALAGPTLALWSREALPVPFAGSYLLLAALALAAVPLVARRSPGATPPAPADAPVPAASVAALLRRPLVVAAILTTAVGHGTMILIMNATPLAMVGCALPVEDAATVIQWHVIGMFAPAFVSGRWVDRFGPRRMAGAGAVVLATSVATATADSGFWAFLASSVLLGVGWNLMMVAGTALLAEGHAPAERGRAQGLMELGNGTVAAAAAFASGAAVAVSGWALVNLLALPAVALAVAGLAATRRRTPATAV